jgi:hypothetical protein
VFFTSSSFHCQELKNDEGGGGGCAVFAVDEQRIINPSLYATEIALSTFS